MGWHQHPPPFFFHPGCNEGAPLLPIRGHTQGWACILHAPYLQTAPAPARPAWLSPPGEGTRCPGCDPPLPSARCWGGGAKSNRSTQSPPSSAFVKVSSARHGGLLYIALISSSSSSRDQRSMRTDRYVQPRAPLCYECVSGVCGTSGRGSQSRRAAHPGRSADHSARCAALFSSGEAGREGPALIHTH